MHATSGLQYWVSAPLFFSLIDSFSILTAFVMGACVRFGGDLSSVIEIDYLFVKLGGIAFVIQITYYWLDLYDLKLFHKKRRLLLLQVKSLVASVIFLTFVYYLAPSLALERGIFGIGILIAWFFTFSSRVFYIRASRGKHFKERILIIGTGDLAEKVSGEILKENSNNFEIVGFVDERSIETKEQTRGRR